MNNLEEFEELAYGFYTNTDQETRITIEDEINHIIINLENVGDLVEILENTNSPYAQLLSITIIKQKITNSWNKIGEKQRLDLRDWMFKFLSEEGVNLTNVILNGLSSLYGRLLKISWLEDQKGNEKLLKKFVPAFFQGGSEQYVLGLKILKQITIEFSAIIKEREFLHRHRQILASFSKLLLQILVLSFNSLYTEDSQQQQNYKNRNNNAKAHELTTDNSLDLIISALSFDMVGLNKAEEIDGNYTFKVSIPISWKNSFKYLGLLFKCYSSLFKLQNKNTHKKLDKTNTTNQNQNQNENQNENNNKNYDNQKKRTNDRGAKIFHILELLASSKRSAFGKKPGRQNFLNQLIEGICYILENNLGLVTTYPDLIHGFTRLNDKILLHYDLNDLEKTEMLQIWLSYLFSLTTKWSTITETKSALYYLGTFWIKATFQLELFRISPNTKTHKEHDNSITYIREIMSKISQTLITYKFQEVAKIEIEDLSNTFEEESIFFIELKALRDLTRIDYHLTFQFIRDNYDIIFQQCYSNSWNEMILREISLLLIIFAQLISQFEIRQESNDFFGLFNTQIQLDNNNNNNMINDNNNNKQNFNIDMIIPNQKIDIFLILRSIEFIKWNEEMILTNSFPNRIEILEFSILYFLKEFLKIYITPKTNVLTNLSNIFEKDMPEFENHTDVFLFIFNKLISNFKTEDLSEKIISRSLKILNLLFNSFKRIINIPDLKEIQDLIKNHNSDIFPFLDIYIDSSDSMYKNFRTIFYHTLSKLIFNERKQTIFWENFEIFIQPFEKTFLSFDKILQTSKNNNNRTNKTNINQINNNNNNRNNNNNNNDYDILAIFSNRSEKTIQYLGLIKDLRGIISGCNNIHYFSHFFNWIYPKKLEILNQIFSITYQIPTISESYLNLLIQLCSINGKKKKHVKSSTLETFPISSPNLYILFKFACNILYEYISETIINIGPYLIQEQITEKTKTITLCYKLLSTIISCKQINFGVYQAFNDNFFEKTLSICFKLSNYYPNDTILIYPKLAKAYFCFFEVLSKRIPSKIILENQENFQKLINHISLSIKSNNTKIYYKACNIITRLIVFYLENYDNRFLKNENKILLANTLHQHFLNNIDNFQRISNQLFNLVFYEYNIEIRAISGILLGLTLINNQLLINFKKYLVDSSLAKYHQGLENRFSQLLEDVAPNLSNQNQNRFSQNLKSFRYHIRENGILF
ncbi:exportin [Anaeramoeba flamelloides]|uniref:Exportin n=1 Tax=Anaeramoeba flamelloides TaxID=1746091 RepID=A0AAV8A061_9EUKA|nr:exportin [Anaeramoeba flamelloides]